MGDGTEQNPYTREDVLKLIAENGGKAKGLDLSGKVFEKGINLRKLDLSGIILKDANLQSAHLEEADLRNAHLEEAAFYEAELRNTKLQGAFIGGTHLTECPDAHLGDADWGNYQIGEESGEKPNYYSASHRYNHLKIWYTQSGYYNMAGEFYYREMEVRRKWLKSRRNPFYIHHLLLQVFRFLCGYGERWKRVVVSAAVVILLSTLIYFGFNSVWAWEAFWHSLYFSAVSFSALGYGGWVKETWIDVTNGWIIGLGVFESLIGVFMMALFLVTFTRKMTR